MKRETRWTGYKVHLTETCDEEGPNLITNVETTTAAAADDAVTEQIHAHLAERQLLPDKHIADTGFVNSELFVSGRKTYGIELIGPTRGDNHWQAKAGAGFAARDFVIDWEQQTATCPQRKTSLSWTPAIDKFKNHVIKIKFGKADCRDCPVSAQCTRVTPPRRTITIRPQTQHEALLAGRQREERVAPEGICSVFFLPWLLLTPRTVLNRLRQMGGLNAVAPGQVSDRPCKLQNAVVGAGAEVELLHRGCKELPARIVHLAELAHFGRPHVCLAVQSTTSHPTLTRTCRLLHFG